MIPKTSGEKGISFSCSWIPLFHGVVSRAWKKDCNSSAASQRQGSSGAGQRQHRGREAAGNAAQPPEHWIQSLPAEHGYMYILRKFNRIFFYFLPELIDQPFKSRRRDSRSGYPPRLFQQGAEAGSDVKACKLNQPFLSAFLHPACSVHPGQEPVLLTSTQGASGQQSWGWEHWECGLWLCRLSLAGIHLFPASIFRLLAPRKTPLLVFGGGCLKCFPLTVLEQFLYPVQ